MSASPIPTDARHSRSRSPRCHHWARGGATEPPAAAERPFENEASRSSSSRRHHNVHRALPPHAGNMSTSPRTVSRSPHSVEQQAEASVSSSQISPLTEADYSISASEADGNDLAVDEQDIQETLTRSSFGSSSSGSSLWSSHDLIVASEHRRAMLADFDANPLRRGDAAAVDEGYHTFFSPRARDVASRGHDGIHDGEIQFVQGPGNAPCCWTALSSKPFPGEHIPLLVAAGTFIFLIRVLHRRGPSIHSTQGD